MKFERAALRDAVKMFEVRAAEAYAGARSIELERRLVFGQTTGRARPWSSYRDDASRYFGALAEYPLWLKDGIQMRAEESVANGKEPFFLDVAGEANGESLGLNTITFSVTATPSSDALALEGSLFIGADRTRLRDTLGRIRGELVYANICMAGGGLIGGTDDFITHPERPEYRVIALKQLERFLKTVYVQLAEGGYITIVEGDILGMDDCKLFYTWLEKQKIPNIQLKKTVSVLGAPETAHFTVITKPRKKN